MDRGDRARDNMRLHLKAETRHANRILDPLLTINNIAPGDDMNHFAVRRNGNRARDFDGATDIVLYNIAMAWRDSDEASAIPRLDMTPGDPYIGCFNFLS